ncbi:MAG: hypothetical protein J5855_05225 [Mailhella sp.]|nr:hypothetical protein [Mailhella sp.]
MRDRNEYEAALREIDALMDAGSGTPEGERLDMLAALVEAYEQKNFPLDLPLS